MPTDSRAAFHRSAAAILAAVLLMALAWTGWRVVQQVRLAPSTVSPATIAASRTLHGDAATRQRATALASGPRWAELTPAQSQVLEPLAERWSMMDALQKRRWIALAEGWDKLSEKEQEKLRDRMQAWSSLSAQQRSQARSLLEASVLMNYPERTAELEKAYRFMWINWLRGDHQTLSVGADLQHLLAQVEAAA